MEISKKENHIIVYPTEASANDFYNLFLNEKETISNNHLIIHFSESFNITSQEILLFLNIANDYRENGTSFVMICTGINIDEIPDEINIVPTLAEAMDVLELDAIERDLMNF